jgi:hypothetical protein
MSRRWRRSLLDIIPSCETVRIGAQSTAQRKAFAEPGSDRAAGANRGLEMGTYLTERELQELNSARDAFESPVPTQIISNGEFTPLPQTPQQKQVEARPGADRCARAQARLAR